jgi:CHASE2 domain-containing sensor protein
MRLRLHEAQPPNDLAVVSIDADTFAALRHQWPFPRRWHARVIDRLRELGARRIVYDVQFSEPSRDPAEDLALFDALKRAPGTVLATSETDGRGGHAILGGPANVAEAGASVGMATFPTIASGEIARMERTRDGMPTLALAAARSLGRDIGDAGFEDGSAWIDYRGPPGTIPTVSFADVYNNAPAARALRGRIVVVGMGAPTLGDTHPTPTADDDLLAGPESQANALWTVLHGVPLRSAPGWASVLALLVLALGPALAALRLRTLALTTAPVLAALYAGIAHVAFAHGWILPVVAPLAGLAASAVGTVTSSYVAERRERRRVSRQNVELEEAVRPRTAEVHATQIEVVHRLARAAEWRDEDTGEHIERIGVLAHRLALAAGMADEDADTLRHAAVLHDVGKIGVPDRVLLKPGKLDPDEWEVMKAHAAIGASMLSGSHSPMVQLAEEIARTHHERWDGTGYPKGLRGEQIPLAGRICALCDVYDALVSRRPYKEAWPVDEALTEIRRQRGRHFDPWLTDLFLGIVMDADAAAPGGEDPPVGLVA